MRSRRRIQNRIDVGSPRLRTRSKASANGLSPRFFFNRFISLTLYFNGKMSPAPIHL
jgi:hypothetical protein